MASYYEGRYSLKVVDTEHRKVAAMCLIIPQGREVEWIFGTEDGLRQVAEQAECGRLIAVTLNRGHSFDLDTVQKELADTVKRLAPGAGIVNFVSPGGVGNRTVLEQGDDYAVEDVDGNRRLVFGNVLQTEVGKKGLISAYHRAMHSLILSYGDDVVLVGLGGGALAMSLRKKMKVRIVEIDADVVRIARQWFGFKGAVDVADGLTNFDDAAAAAKTDVVAVDVDAKDPSVGVSCPPPAFVTCDYLHKLKRTCRTVIYNVVARDARFVNDALANFKRVFAKVAHVKPDPDDLNLVIVAGDDLTIRRNSDVITDLTFI